jgi:hypothetical protein
MQARHMGHPAEKDQEKKSTFSHGPRKDGAPGGLHMAFIVIEVETWRQQGCRWAFCSCVMFCEKAGAGLPHSIKEKPKIPHANPFEAQGKSA